MQFDIVTIFPEFFSGPLDYGIVRRAREAGLLDVRVRDLREFTHDRHRTVDDRPFGGGEGMVLKPEPLFEAVESLLNGSQASRNTTAVVLLSAAGRLFCQETARRYAGLERIVLLCGRYEGVDERVSEHLATEEVSVGDFVLSGGELPAAMIVDGVTRLLPGALGNAASAIQESFSAETGVQPPAVSGQPASHGGQAPAADRPAHTPSAQGPRWGILDCPHYPRPADFRGWQVPEVLLSGNHEEIRRWRRRMALAKTLRNRPDLFAGITLGPEELNFLDELRARQ